MDEEIPLRNTQAERRSPEVGEPTWNQGVQGKDIQGNVCLWLPALVRCCWAVVQVIDDMFEAVHHSAWANRYQQN